MNFLEYQLLDSYDAESKYTKMKYGMSVQPSTARVKFNLFSLHPLFSSLSISSFVSRMVVLA